uniref:M20_dimer domain-containing protein n=1 Tax=Macrostomum lignano TaxID=282301 RepID=A0A1I8GNY4_9PLAT
MARTALVTIACLAGLLSCLLLLNSLNSRSIRLTLRPCAKSDEDFIQLTEERLARFQRGLRFRTVSYDIGRQDTQQLAEMVSFIRSSFPRVHSAKSSVKLTVINQYSLLYKVQGSDSSLLPALLMSHLDVVPTDGQNWTKPHFDAVVEDGYIYARGTIDDKVGVFGILEAMEYLLAKDWKPKRTFYIAFGHDEEIHGFQGAARIAEHLRTVEKVQKLEFVSDEGMVVLDGFVPGLSAPAIIIGVSEKGYVNLRLSYNSTPGHSSMPPAESVIGVLARAVARLEASQQPSQLGNGPEKAILELLSTYLKLPFPANIAARVVLNNLWLFKPLVSYRNPPTNALIRTTTAVTMFNAGIKHNVLASSAQAVVNHRIHPSQTIQQVVDHDRQVIADPRIQIEILDGIEASPVADCEESSYAFQVVAGTAQQVFTDGRVLPGIFVAKTDTNHYLQFTRNVYRFTPNHIHMRDANRYHGVDERIGVTVFEKAINFYYHLLRNADLPREQSGQLLEVLAAVAVVVAEQRPAQLLAVQVAAAVRVEDAEAGLQLCSDGLPAAADGGAERGELGQRQAPVGWL